MRKMCIVFATSAILSGSAAQIEIVEVTSKSTYDSLSYDGGSTWSTLTSKSVVTNRGVWSVSSSFYPDTWYYGWSTNVDREVSASSSGLLLDHVGCRDDGFEKKFVVKSASCIEYGTSDTLIHNGGTPSTITEDMQMGSSLEWMSIVSCGGKMPASPPELYDLTDELKMRVRRTEHIIDGCYVYLNEPMGVVSNATYAVLPVGCHRLFTRIFEEGGVLRTLEIDGAIDNIQRIAFDRCTNLTTLIAGDVDTARAILDACPTIGNLILKEGVTTLDRAAFARCENLKSVTLPSSMVAVGREAFSGCSRLTDVEFLGDAPELGEDMFWATPKRLTVKVPDGSIGWSGDLSEGLPQSLLERRIVHSESQIGDGEQKKSMTAFSLTVTNVVVHYIQPSACSDIVVPVTPDVGIVNVMTEVKGGCLAIPESWAANYPEFGTRFGSDFSLALTSLSGKKDAAGNALMVWQDFVAGTDPTDEADTFKASVTVAGGKPVVSWTPELSAPEAAKRKYTVYGKKSLTEAEWCVVPTGNESDYNFFKVTVEMK